MLINSWPRSNCVVNLSPDKDAVLREAFRVLKNGGEMFFSDVYADRRVPDELVRNSLVLGTNFASVLIKLSTGSALAVLSTGTIS